MEKPNINYALAHQKFRGELNSHIAAMQQRIPIPTYMVEGILAGILTDVRSAVISENSLEVDAFRENLDKYYEDREKELNMVRKYIEEIKVYEDKFTIRLKAKVEIEVVR